MSNISYALTLMLKTETTHEGPGWYLIGHGISGDRKDTIAPRRVSAAQAETLARAFEEMIPVGDETIEVRPFRIVKEGTADARQAVQARLEEAEHVATTVPQLRRILGDFGES